MLSEKNSRFLRDLWRLVRPYWFSEERSSARLLLAAITPLLLATRAGRDRVDRIAEAHLLPT